MLDSLELTAYRAAVNLPLLNDIIAFIRDASEASPGKRAALRRNCVFLDASASGGAFQEKYGFLYLGELLERYEERFGMSARDFRAIALALAYAKDLTDDSMFVGPHPALCLCQWRVYRGEIPELSALYRRRPKGRRSA